MRYTLKGTNIELTGAIKVYVEEKIGTLDKHLGEKNENVSAAVEIGRDTHHHKKGEILFAEVNLRIGGKLFRVKKFGYDVRAAIDEVRDDLELEINKFKGRRETLFKRGARSIKKLLRLSPYARFRRSKLEE